MSKTFVELGVAAPIVAALDAIGISETFPIQEMTIADALAGRDVCGKAKTGSGKTLAFGIPAAQLLSVAKKGQIGAVILVPTRELATQVFNELEPLAKAVGVTSLAVYGGADIEKQIAKLNKGVELVVATPGRMIDLMDRGVVEVGQVSLAIIDEADRMADMGFLPQVEWILRRVEGVHQTLLFSATLDGAIDGLVTRYQNDPVRHEVEAKEVTVEEMVHRFVTVHEMDRTKVVAAIVNSTKRTMVFCNTKRACDRLANDLDRLGVAAQAIHGDLRQRQREKALRDFSEGRTQALVATDVAARGIHVDDVDVVLHFNPPDDHKTYLHRSGRTARAGGSGVAVTLVLWNEELEVKRMQKRLALDIPIVEMFSNDSRLGDLAGWDPTAVA
ncbi:MAG: DEAD/DEAH box helicase [Actinomycetia bacterium]|nr:DEAD/DEAH box helicase [Actinomycetes bacterium]MCP4222177.1 DEAD/DEAH box helicase [Actinomycetes bacterium]MCP5032758.1 DEAD/DEAH box helicase [Actinomycetes bacterium]